MFVQCPIGRQMLGKFKVLKSLMNKWFSMGKKEETPQELAKEFGY